MGFQEDISDLKSVSFDLLYNQVSSLVSSYDELNFSGDMSESFRRKLTLLHNTIGSMRNLIKNVEEFGGLNNSIAEVDSENKISESISNSGLVFNDFNYKETETNDLVDSDSDINIAESSSLLSNVANDDTTVVPIDDNSSESVNDIVLDINNVSSDTGASDNDVNVRAIASLTKFYKNSDKPAKAIIVNDNQYGKLLNSLNVQRGFLDFGVVTASDNVSIEAMIEKANDLYSRGEKEAAEKLYEQINNMTLVKKVE